MTGISIETRFAISDLNARFAWALDGHNYEQLYAVLAPDVHYVGVAGNFHDVESVVASFRARTQPRTTRHGLGNMVLAARDDGRVTGRSSWHTFASNAEPAVGIGLALVADFNDVYVHLDGGWRIQERIVTPIFREPALAPHLLPQAPIKRIDPA